MALANRKDHHHDRARKVLVSLDEALVTETCYLLLEGLGPLSEQRFLGSFASGLDA